MENLFKSLANRNIFSESLMSFYDDSNHNNVINNILGDVLNMYNAGRAYVFLYDFERNVQRYSYEVCAEGVEAQIGVIGEVPLSDTDNLNSIMFEYQPYIINDVEDLKEVNINEYEILKLQEIKSLIIIPIIHKDGILGYIGVDMVSEKKEWIDQDISTLYILSKIISVSIATSIEFNKSKKEICNRSLNQAIMAIQRMYRTIPIGIELYDSAGVLLDMNDTDYQIFGIEKKDFPKGRSIFDNPLVSEEHKAALRRGEDYDALIDYDFSLISKYYKSSFQDEIKYISCKTQVIKDDDGNIINYLNFLTDITQVRNMQQELVRAKNKAEESERLKMSFLANMSHEIRTPLNSIVGFSELLSEDLDKDERSEYIKIIRTNNELLLRLINDILDLSKMESGVIEIKPETFDVVEVFDEFYLSFKERFHPDVSLKRNYNIKKCKVTLDKNRISQIHSNFMSNAMKYTPKGTVTMGLDYIDGGIKFFVQDTGIGIPENKKHLVFQRFEKLDDFAQGTGLGLAICKVIAETLDGRIGFESTEGQGSRFWVWLPCLAKEVVRIEPHPVLNANHPTSDISEHPVCLSLKGQSLRILIAEDNDSNYMLLKAILKGHTMRRTLNGADAVQAIGEEDFDAVLMDIRMPVMDGLEATRQIRLTHPHLPIIALTANAFDSDQTAAFEAGCNDFISKPIKKSDLYKSLTRLI